AHTLSGSFVVLVVADCSSAAGTSASAHAQPAPRQVPQHPVTVCAVTQTTRREAQCRRANSRTEPIAEASNGLMRPSYFPNANVISRRFARHIPDVITVMTL